MSGLNAKVPKCVLPLLPIALRVKGYPERRPSSCSSDLPLTFALTSQTSPICPSQP